MKFGRYLEENSVVEWKRAYLKYRGLKKLIKRVDAHRRARLDLELQLIGSDASGGSSFAAVAGGSTAADGSNNGGRAWKRIGDGFLRQRSGASFNLESQTQGGRGGGSVSGISFDGEGRSYGGTDRSAPLLNVTRYNEEISRLPPVTFDGTGLNYPLDYRLQQQQQHQHEEEEEQMHGTGGNIGPSAPASRTPSEEEEMASQSNTLTSRLAPVGLRDDIEYEDGAPGSNQGSEGVGKPALSFVDPPLERERLNAPEEGRSTGVHTRKESFGKKTKKEKKKTRKQEVLSEILDDNLDEEEKKFFWALDNELDLIVSFYEERESDMAKRYEILASQLEELSEHRRMYKALHPQHDQQITHQQGTNSWLVDFVQKPVSALRNAPHQASATGHEAVLKVKSHAGDTKSAADAKRKLEQKQKEEDEGDRRRSLALSRMFNVNGGFISEADDAELRKHNKDAAMSQDPERYKAARKKLKVAVLEYYKGLEILKNYKILNRTGIAKILKKFEKTTEVRCADAYYRAKVAPSILVASESVEKLIKSTEEIFTAYFEHGNRKKALDRLRVNASGQTVDPRHTHHLSVARAGFFVGVALCATVGGLIEAMHPDTQATIPQWRSLLRVYGAELIPTLFALLFGVNLAAWHKARVNTVFIFEWDVRHALDFHQYFELPAFFILLLSLAFWVSFLNPFPESIAPTTWPIVYLVVVVVILVTPLPVANLESRRWFVTSICRCFHGGLLSSVEFRDFFLADELNSLAWSLSSLWFIGCEYQDHWAFPERCDPNKTFWTAALLSVPALLRLAQCLRRFRDSDFTARLHLINAGKYTSSILYSWLYVNYRYHGSSRHQDLALWCVFGTIYSSYTIAWDLVMDWSLLRPHARYPFLRDELVFESHWPLYYFAIVTNVIGRFAWIIYLLPGPASSLTRIFIIALLEMLRRFQWNFFRLENEHLGNVDMYRVSREVPLPYRLDSKPDVEDEDEDYEEREEANKRGIRGALSGIRLRRTRHDTAPPKDDPEADIEEGGEEQTHDQQQQRRGGREQVEEVLSENEEDEAAAAQRSRSEASGVREAPASSSSTTPKKPRRKQSRSQSFLQSLKKSLVPDDGGLAAHYGGAAGAGADSGSGSGSGSDEDGGRGMKRSTSKTTTGSSSRRFGAISSSSSSSGRSGKAKADTKAARDKAAEKDKKKRRKLRLDEIGAAHGSSGRDYQPQTFERGSESELDDDDDDDDDHLVDDDENIQADKSAKDQGK